MAMVACKECGKDISSQAEACPHCGIKRQPASKIINTAVSIIAMLLFLGYCSSVFNSNSPTKTLQSALSDAPDCGPASFTVSKPDAKIIRNYAHLTGVIRHTCPTAAGVELKWTAFNKDGSVAFSNDFWPASVSNIPPNTDYPFEMMEEAPRGEWTFQVTPISTRHWR